MGVLVINQDNFETEVKNFKGTVVLDFWAPWCGPCRMLAPIIEELAHEVEADKNIKICKINVDENQKLAEDFNITNIPFVAIFKSGKLVYGSAGLKNKQTLLNLISSNE